MFLSVLNLAASTNQNGYTTALFKTWRDQDFNHKDTASKSSLSEYRNKVSYKFFEDIYRADLTRLNPSRKKFRDYFIYAIDGDQTDLPLSKDILAHGFRGYPCKGNNKETHYPKMYSAQVYDLINGLVVDFAYDTVQAEVHLAREMVQKLEQNSITIYDRLYFSYHTAFAHAEANNY